MHQWVKKISKEALFVLQFSIDDFKKKYLGSFLGVAWAFLQPLITIMIYWFVFQIGFKSTPVGDFPFILWLISGLIPWFFFSESITAGTSCLMDYEYLVKKVKFNIDILPSIKIISCFLVQLFLVVFTIIAFWCFGYAPDLYDFQLLYYALYMIVLAQGITYITAALYVFFRDALQIIAIVLQVVFWMTPMVWAISTMPESVQNILKYNPFFFVVQGYRKSLISKELFTTDSYIALLYWAIAIAIFFLGRALYRKLKPHFADIM